ncbi:RNA-directed DNA polymerase-like protein [Cucumis melo var. makuwa]|uniref:RNA-directed DNA polymerase-like protein n=1 Tax=Cucumis melo var. makuwa TaxID=1194695 RepID=A0A5D3BVL6_CUCMM|nr:RNA-directed DNA polymerase-like protein [Cucumis melo var. makuwa]
MQLKKSHAQEPPSAAILLGALGKLGETIPKDTLCIPEKCHGLVPNSWPKSLSMRRRTDHGIESPSEAKAHAKNAYRTTPLKLAVLRKQSKKLSTTGVNRPVQASWGAPVLSLKKKDRSLQRCIGRRIQNKLTVRHIYPFPLLPNLFDGSRGVKCFPKSDIQLRYCRINVLGHVVELHQVEVGKRKIVTTCKGRILKSVAALRSGSKPINGNGQSMKGFLTRASSQDGVDDQAAYPRRNNAVRLSINLEQEEDREVKEVLADKVRTDRRPTRKIHKFLVEWENPLVKVTSRERVKDLEA